MNDTRDLIIRNYHSLLRREAGLEGRAKRTLFRAFARTLGPWVPKDKEAHILDVGCGEGAFLAFLQETGYSNLSGFDLSPENVEICRARGLEFVRPHDALEFASFPGPAEGWDTVFCLDLIEHLPKQVVVGLLMDIRAQLAEGGCLVLQTPNMAHICAAYLRYNDVTHEDGYTENSLLSLLSASGFAPVELKPAWNATRIIGHLREMYLSILHRAVYLCEGRNAPQISTRNLLARAYANNAGDLR